MGSDTHKYPGANSSLVSRGDYNVQQQGSQRHRGKMIHKEANLVFRIYSVQKYTVFSDFESPYWLICLTNFSAKEGQVLVATWLP